jgi:hypothetical protein
MYSIFPTALLKSYVPKKQKQDNHKQVEKSKKVNFHTHAKPTAAMGNCR